MKTKKPVELKPVNEYVEVMAAVQAKAEAKEREAELIRQIAELSATTPPTVDEAVERGRQLNALREDLAGVQTFLSGSEQRVKAAREVAVKENKAAAKPGHRAVIEALAEAVSTVEQAQQNLRTYEAECSQVGVMLPSGQFCDQDKIDNWRRYIHKNSLV